MSGWVDKHVHVTHKARQRNRVSALSTRQTPHTQPLEPASYLVEAERTEFVVVVAIREGGETVCVGA